MIPRSRRTFAIRGKRMEWANAESMRPAKSTFVTVVAWIFIGVDGLSSFIALIQNILLNTVFPWDQIREGMAKAQNADKLPALFAWMFQYFRLFAFLFLVFSV